MTSRSARLSAARPRAAIASITALLALGCGSAPVSFVAPPIELWTSHFRGSLFEGPRMVDPSAPPPALDFDDLLAVRCRLWFVERYDRDGLTPLAERTRMIIAARGREPLAPAPVLAAGALVGLGEPANRFLERLAGDRSIGRATVGELQGVLPADCTFTISARSPRLIEDDAIGTARSQAALFVSRRPATTGGATDPDPPGPIVVSLVIEDLEPGPPGVVDSRGDAKIVQRQLSVLEDAPPIGGAPLVIVIPDRTDPDRRRGFVAVLEIHPAEPGSFDEAIAACRGDLDDNAAAVVDRTIAFADQQRLSVAMSSAIEALKRPRNHRPALVFLANASTAPFARDLAISADDATVAAWVAELRLGEDPTGERALANLGELGWKVERTAYLVLARRAMREGLTPELDGLLLRHTGAIGRYPVALQRLIAEADDHLSLEELLIRENRTTLESVDPAQRVRAHDWLLARHRERLGFDPLGDRAERRVALESGRWADEPAPTTPEVPGDG